MREVLAIALGSVLTLSSAAAAQEAGRYQLGRSDEGYVRMDTATGQISVCRENEHGLACRPAGDEHAAREDALAKLRERVGELEERIARLEEAARPDSGLPSEEEFEKSLGFMERFFRRFMDIVQDMEKEEGKEPSPSPAPGENRT